MSVENYITTLTGAIVILDREDYEKYHGLSIRVEKTNKKFYAILPNGVYLHRDIMGDPTDKLVDHENGVTLDNRRKNLRICTHRQNTANSVVRKNNRTGFRGVSKVGGRYQARIKENGKRRSLGYFDTAEEAASVWAIEHKKIHGEFSNV